MSDRTSSGFSEAERKAMKARARELAAEKRKNRKKVDGEKEVLAAFEAMSGNDKEMGMRIHQIVSQTAPALWPKTWYGMPAYAVDGKKVVCYYQSAEKGEARYATFGFNDIANLDDGSMWPTSYALLELTSKEESAIRELVKKAVS
jgi:uncharacterized protein YdhG (YjbR/CyaY superfamily)